MKVKWFTNLKKSKSVSFKLFDLWWFLISLIWWISTWAFACLFIPSLLISSIFVIFYRSSLWVPRSLKERCRGRSSPVSAYYPPSALTFVSSTGHHSGPQGLFLLPSCSQASRVAASTKLVPLTSVGPTWFGFSCVVPKLSQPRRF